MTEVDLTDKDIKILLTNMFYIFKDINENITIISKKIKRLKTKKL